MALRFSKNLGATCGRNVFKHRQVVEEIELLEHHADLLSVLVHIKALGRDVLALEVNFAGGGLLQEVQASDKGGLTAARGTDDVRSEISSGSTRPR